MEVRKETCPVMHEPRPKKHCALNGELRLPAVAFNPTTRGQSEAFLLPSKRTNNSFVSSRLGVTEPEADESAQV